MSDNRVAGAYDDWATSYDTDVNRTRDLDAEVVRSAFAGRRFATIVEIGCGTGKNTGFLASIGASVQAFDFSAGMLEVARAKVGSPRVTFGVADATATWPVATASADLVTCDLVLEHVEDLGHVAIEAVRVLRPGGLWFVCELHPFRQYEGKHAHFRRGDQVTSVPCFVHHVSDYLQAGLRAGLQVHALHEWWHADDAGRPPRLLSLELQRP